MARSAELRSSPGDPVYFRRTARRTVSAKAASSRPLAYAALALSMGLVGSYVALSKPLAAAFPVMLLAWLRFGIGGVAMLPWLNKPADEPPMNARTRSSSARCATAPRNEVAGDETAAVMTEFSLKLHAFYD